MCLAIVMYLISGLIAIILQLLLALGIFLLTLLGKIIIFVCASLYTVVKPRRREAAHTEELPFETMYPEYVEFEENLKAMSRVSLETLSSSDSQNESHQQLCEEGTQTQKKKRLRGRREGTKKNKTRSKSTNTQLETINASVNTDSSLFSYKEDED